MSKQGDHWRKCKASGLASRSRWFCRYLAAWLWHPACFLGWELNRNLASHSESAQWCWNGRLLPRWCDHDSSSSCIFRSIYLTGLLPICAENWAGIPDQTTCCAPNSPLCIWMNQRAALSTILVCSPPWTKCSVIYCYTACREGWLPDRLIHAC